MDSHSHSIYHTTSGLPFIDVNGKPVVLGALASSRPVLASKYTDKSKWHNASQLEYVDFSITPAKPDGSCALVAVQQALNVVFKKNGLSEKITKASSVYEVISSGDSGCIVETALSYYLEHELPIASFKAKGIELNTEEVFDFGALCAGLSEGKVAVADLAAGRNFVRGYLRENFIANLPDVIVGGHTVTLVGLKKFDNFWAVECVPNWGSGWGNKGACYLMEGHWSEGFGFQSCWHLLSCVVQSSISGYTKAESKAQETKTEKTEQKKS